MGKPVKIVVYRLPEGFTRVVEVPKDEFSEDAVKKYIEEDLKELYAWRGKKIKVSVPTGT